MSRRSAVLYDPLQERVEINPGDVEEPSDPTVAELIKKKECVRFVERNGQSTDDPLCYCNYSRSQHSGGNDNSPPWDHQRDTETLSTDALGTVTFDSSNSNKRAKYARVAEDTKDILIWKLLTKDWDLEPPNLLISVAGGSMNDVEQKLKIALQRALVDTASTTKAWIFTGGMNGGASQLVGKAIQKYSKNRKKIALIGISSWGWVRNKEILQQRGENAVPYTFEQTRFDDSGPLDSNHTHFLLVDNGTQNDVGVEENFREQLEKFISQTEINGNRDIDDCKIDVLCDSIRQLKRKIRYASCEIGNIDTNPVLEFAKHVVFPYIGQRDSPWCLYIDGAEIEEYEDLKTKYQNQGIEPDQLKDGIIDWLEDTYKGTRTKQQTVRNTGLEERVHTINPLYDGVSQMKENMRDIDNDDDLLNFTEHVVFPHLGRKDFVIKRNGNDPCIYKNYDDLAQEFGHKKFTAAELEGALTDMLDTLPHKGFVIPLVVIVIAGGPDTLYTVRKAVKSGTPVIVIKGTGGAADLLTYASIIENDENDRENLRAKLAMCGWNPDHHITTLMELVRQKDKFFIFNPGSSDTLNTALLKAIELSKENNGDDTDKYILQLALIWNRIDLISEKHVIINYDTMQMEYLEELMSMALKQDKPEFVKLFLSQGVKLDGFCKRYQMSTFYNEGYNALLKEQKSLLQTLIEKHGDKQNDEQEQVIFLNDKDIDTFLANMMSGSKALYCNDQPVYKLFIWSLLMLREDLAKLFWSWMLKGDFDESHRPIQSAMTSSLCADILLNEMVKYTDDNKQKIMIENLKQYFIEKSVDLLRACHANNKENTQELLVEELSYMNKKTSCIELALDASDEEFLSHASCQSLVEDIWKRKFRNKEKCARVTGPVVSPFFKFILNHVSYFAFLVLYSVVLLTRFYPMPNMHPLEIVLIIWIATFFFEEIRQVLIHRVRDYFKDKWNLFDIAILVSYLLGLIFRLIPQKICSGCFEAAIITLAINLMMFTLRILPIFMVIKKFGEKLFMIERMINDLILFLMIFVVFIAAYGLALQVVMYPNAELDRHLLSSVFRKAYWQVYGELFLEELEGDVGDCSSDAMVYNNNTLGIPRCPVNTWFGPILLALYILITNVLMLNLLIAMFNYTFNQVHDRSYKEWQCKRITLIKEFAMRPLVPPPFNLPHLIYLIVKRCRKRETSSVFRKRLDKDLNTWENETKNDFLNNFENTGPEYDERNRQVRECKINFQTIQNRLELIEQSLQLNRLELIEQSLQPKLQIETGKLTECKVPVGSKVEDTCVLELAEDKGSGITHNFSRRHGSVIPCQNMTFIVCGGDSQFTIVKFVKEGHSLKHRIYNTYSLPEGMFILSGVMIRQHIVNGRKCELYMFVTETEGKERHIFTVSIISNTRTLRARFMTEYSPIHPFLIGKYSDNEDTQFGVLCSSYGESDINRINRICVFSQEWLENPPDIYQDNLHHNTIRGGCSKIIDLLGSDGGKYNTICVTSRSNFCLSMFTKNNVLIYDRYGTNITTVGRGSPGALHKPRTVLCTSDDHILVVCYEGDVHMLKPDWDRIGDSKGAPGNDKSSEVSDSNEVNDIHVEMKVVRGKLNKRVANYKYTYNSTVFEEYMWCVEWKDEKCKLRVYQIQTPDTHPPQTQMQSITSHRPYTV